MKRHIGIISIIFFALSFFMFGWLSHGAYTPVKKQEITRLTLLDKIKAIKELHVVFLNSPSVYYIGTDGPRGFEYDILKAYADSIDVKLKITVANTVEEAIAYVGNPDVHIISASLAKTELRKKSFNFGPSYFEVQQQVVCNRKMKRKRTFPHEIENLQGLNIIVGEGTSYAETIKKLQKDGFDINATFTSEFSTDELLGQVASRKIDCTIADSNIYALNLRHHPEISLAFTISEREQLAWVLADDSETLKTDMYTWLNNFNQDGSMAQLKDHYYSSVNYFNYYNTTVFYKRIKTRLPSYRYLFEGASKKYGIPWKLLAAISYQESYWNPNAVSFTGVKGLMMLTNATAELLGVTNRVDPKQSVYGGAKHIRYMMKVVPKGVEGENRLKFALASYNVGLGHIHDAQKLAKEMGLNPNVWSDIKQVLPLLSSKKYYQNLKYGYARGEEPVKYVDSIYDFRDILEKHFAEKVEVKKEIKVKDVNTSKEVNATKVAKEVL